MATNEKELLEKESMNINLKRVPSVGTVGTQKENLNWERCQSDVNLTEQKESSQNQSNTQVSDNSTVYWDLSQSEEGIRQNQIKRVDIPGNTPGFQMNLETIVQQNDEFGDNLSSSTFSDQSTGIGQNYASSSEENYRKNSSYGYATENYSLDRLTNTPRNKRLMSEVETRKSCSALPISRRISGGRILDGEQLPNEMSTEEEPLKMASAACLITTGGVMKQAGNKLTNQMCANYFCESDYDANREVIPNYQVKLKILQDEFSELIAQLEIDTLSFFQWPSDESIETKTEALKACLRMIKDAWLMLKVGRDIASSLCDQIRNQGLLKYLTECLSIIGQVCEVSGDQKKDSTDAGANECLSKTNSLRRMYGLTAAKLFSQILTLDNIDAILGLSSGSSTPKGSNQHYRQIYEQYGDYDTIDESSVKLFKNLIRQGWLTRGDRELNYAFICILEGLVKHHEKTNRLVIRSGGLRTLVYSCRSSDTKTLRHLAFSMVNLALFGDFDIHCTMAELKVADWLFPLAFHNDDVIKYYACLAIVILSSHRELAQVVYSSGTIELVLSFLQSHSPYEFAEIEPSHLQGRSKKWLEHMLRILQSSSMEAVSLASFHFVMEARIKQRQGKIDIFYEIGAVDILKKVARGIYREAAEYARQALKILREPLPYSLSHPVSIWSSEDVCNWLSETSFDQYRQSFQDLQIDGDILMTLTDEMLNNDLNITNKIVRMRLLREITQLKNLTLYQPCDPSGLCDWIRKHVGSEYTYYTYSLLKAGVDRKFLSRITETMLLHDCNMTNSVHRARFLKAVEIVKWFGFVSDDNKLCCNCKVKFARDTSKYNTISSDHDLTKQHLNRPTEPSHQSMEEPNAPPDFEPNLLGTNTTQSSGVSGHVLDHCIVSNHADDSQYLCDPSGIFKNIDVFISYRRSNGAQLASLLMVHLRLRGYRVFLDIERLPAGKFNENLLQSIQRARNFIIVLTPNCLDRCFHDVDKKDWIHREIACALQNGCNIIPVTDRFDFPTEEKLPKDIRSILNYNAVNWVHDYQEACVEKIEQFMLHPSVESFTKCPFSPPQRRQPPIIPAPSYSPGITTMKGYHGDYLYSDEKTQLNTLSTTAAASTTTSSNSNDKPSIIHITSSSAISSAATISTTTTAATSNYFINPLLTNF